MPINTKPQPRGQVYLRFGQSFSCSTAIKAINQSINQSIDQDYGYNYIKHVVMIAFVLLLLYAIQPERTRNAPARITNEREPENKLPGCFQSTKRSESVKTATNTNLVQ